MPNPAREASRGWDCIWKPLQRGPVVFRTRVGLAPINTGFAHHGRATRELADFYIRRSGPDIGFSTLGNTAVSADGVTNGGTLILEDGSQVRALRRITAVIQSKGTVPGVQLSWSLDRAEPRGRWRPRDLATELAKAQAQISALADSQIRGVLNAFVRSTRMAADAGFKVVQLHGAHGYFLHALMTSLLNRRSGKYRYLGDWLNSFVNSIRAAASGSLLAWRLSVITGMRSPEEDVAETKQFVALLEEGGVDIIDVSAGLYRFSRSLIYPSKGAGHFCYLPVAVEVASHTKCLVVVAGNVMDLGRMTQAYLPRNLMLSVGRAMIADPDYVSKSRAQRPHQILACDRNGHCHYSTRSRSQLSCPVNPVLRDEVRYG